MINSRSLTLSPCQARACSKFMTSAQQILKRAALHGSSIAKHAGSSSNSSRQVYSSLPENSYLLAFSDRPGKVRLLTKACYGARTFFRCRYCWVPSLQSPRWTDMSKKSDTLLGVSIWTFWTHAHTCARTRTQRDLSYITSSAKLHLLANSMASLRSGTLSYIRSARARSKQVRYYAIMADAEESHRAC